MNRPLTESEDEALAALLTQFTPDEKFSGVGWLLVLAAFRLGWDACNREARS